MDLYFWVRTWALLCILAVCRGQTEEDEKRPYKFAFAIEGYQHRSEEKDERGIIMGEFGFVTGDGVYHVTVYATDENGNFKILKMKNFYIGLPGEGTTATPSRAPPPTPSRTTPVPPTPSTTKSPIIKHLEGLMGCSGCIIPNKTNGNNGGSAPGNTAGEGLLDERFGGDEDPKRPGHSPGTPGRPLFGGGQSVNPSGTLGGSGGNTFSGGGGSSTYNEGSKPGGLGGVGIGGGGGTGGGGSGGGLQGQRPLGGNSPGGASQYNPNSGQFDKNPQSPVEGGAPSRGGFESPPSTQGGSGVKRPGGNYGAGLPGTGGFGQSKPGFPTSTTGLPPGMTMEDLMELLYKFNYTLKYHGHNESGYRNGNKEGGYFFNGRDGLGRNVKYIANEFGFQPNITLVELGLQSPDTPQGENEDNELRGNEFKWFYNR